MTKPVYKYPSFITDITLEKTDTKRYWLKLEFDQSKKESIVCILKNPSRADMEVSDKTVYNVSSYIYRNRIKHPELKNVGSIIILNLMPHYQTYSNQLEHVKNDIVDLENLATIKRFASKINKVIIAWGNAPQGLFNEYEQLKSDALNVLSENNNTVLYVDKISKAGNPKHGQIWGYEDALIPFKY